MTFEEMKARYMKEMGAYSSVIPVAKKETKPAVNYASPPKDIEESIITVPTIEAENETKPPLNMEEINETQQEPPANTPQIKLPVSTGRGGTNDNFNTYTETGYIKVTVFAANQAIPVPGAKVTISKYSGTEPLLLIETITDENGNTPVISVPTPPKELSQQPYSTIPPYGLYNVVVSVENFRSVPIYNVMVFSGVISIQPVELNLLVPHKEEKPTNETSSDNF